jgi:large subunit ribosomal protein L10
MSKKIKALELAALKSAFGTTKDYVLLEPVKVDAATDYTFRKTLRAKSIRVQMVKNSYAKKLFGEMGVNAGNVWSSTTLLCWGGANMKELSNTIDDAVKASKKDPKAPEKYVIKTAVSEGSPISMEMAKKLPTREEAIANVLGCVLAPGANLAAAILGAGSTMMAVVKTIEENAKKSETAPAA